MYIKGAERSNGGGMRRRRPTAAVTGDGAGVAKRCYLELSRECSLLFG